MHLHVNEQFYHFEINFINKIGYLLFIRNIIVSGKEQKYGTVIKL